MRRSLLLVAPVFFYLVFLLTGSLHSQESQSKSPKVSDSLESPRLAALAREIDSGKHDAMQRFWEEMKGKTPLVETIPGDDRLRRVTFLWRGGDDARGIILIGPLPHDVRQKPLSRFRDTDLWFLTVRFPAAARFSYAFALAGKKYTDPLNLNPLTVESESMAVMADAPPQPWIQPQPNVPTGTLKQHKVRSEILKEERTVTVYTPAGYDAQKEPNGLLIVFDGEDYRRLIPLPTVLDNLIANKKIVPMVAIMMDGETQTTRNRELACDPTFTDFLAKELIPWARQNYRLSANPKQTIACGASLGGVSAAYCALRYPEIFGNVLSQSGAFWYYRGWPDKKAETPPPGWLTGQFAASRKLPVRFYLEAGLFETDLEGNILIENRRLRDVLEAKGYPVVYTEFAGGHDFIYWRGSLADGLIALAGRS